jgi:hypothetical protein
MATRYESRTFSHIVTQIMNLLKLQETDTVSKNRIKADVQRAYLQEIMPFHQWPWLRNKIHVQTEAYHATGTATVTQNSVTVTLSESVTHSRSGYYFSVDGQNDIYKISSHTAGSATLTLDVPYISTTSSTAKFKIWTDSIPLPADAMEILQVTHPGLVRPIEGVGLQELRRIQAMAPKAEGRPSYLTLGDWIDPAPYATISGMPSSSTRASAGLVRTIVLSGTLGSSTTNLLLKVGDRIQLSGASSYHYNGEFIVSSVSTTTSTNDTITFTGLTVFSESSTSDTGITIKLLSTESYERQRELLVYPSIFNSKVTLTVDYIKEIAALEADDDEPALPLQDRVVLYWLGLSYAYSRERNPEEAQLYRDLAYQRLIRMAGNTTESTDKPSFLPSRLYLGTKRNANRSRIQGRGDGALAFGSSATTNPSGTPNTVAIFGSDGTLQSSATVNTTELGYIDGLTSNVEARLAEVVPLTSATLTDNTGSPTNVVTWDVATYSIIVIDYSIYRSTAVEAGRIHLVSNGTTTGFAQGVIASVGTHGVTFTADTSGGLLRLRYTTTSTGANATMKYRAWKWLAS